MWNRFIYNKTGRNGLYIPVQLKTNVVNMFKYNCCVFSLYLQVESGYVAEADHKTMAKAIKDRVSLILKKREQRKLVREEQEKRKQEAEQQQQETLRSSQTQVC